MAQIFTAQTAKTTGTGTNSKPLPVSLFGAKKMTPCATIGVIIPVTI